MMLLTIGMASWNNPVELWFTLTALRLYQDLSDTELLVIDNAGNGQIEKICRFMKTKYHLYTEKVGPQQAKNELFRVAEGYFTLSIDSHVMLFPNAVSKLKVWIRDNEEDAKGYITGPMAYSSQLDNDIVVTHWEPEWRGNMYGIWAAPIKGSQLSDKPIEIEMMGTGLFGCRKDSWVGFHPDNVGFGSAEGYIHEKFRQAGRKVLCLPFLKWVHNFEKENASFPNSTDGRIANYLRSFDEIGWDKQPIHEHFGTKIVQSIERKMNSEQT